ncbi:MAG: hypothetical protein JO316_09870 [Abitibacteriaceae bacterium]|nr:hypothetical protein [Abditibacteriaceae bacterium]MBV9865646.1 hypothetical protein [Abditibacteriaceae bacterium]
MGQESQAASGSGGGEVSANTTETVRDAVKLVLAEVVTQLNAAHRNDNPPTGEKKGFFPEGISYINITFSVGKAPDPVITAGLTISSNVPPKEQENTDAPQ